MGDAVWVRIKALYSAGRMEHYKSKKRGEGENAGLFDKMTPVQSKKSGLFHPNLERFGSKKP